MSDPVGIAVEADLRVEVTTAAGASTTAVVTGDGPRVRVETPRPEVLFAAVDRADAGRIADLLADMGVTVAVNGPHGSVATLGAGTSSLVGRVVTGSTRVAPAPRAALQLVLANRAGLAVLVPALLVALSAVVRLLRTRRR